MTTNTRPLSPDESPGFLLWHVTNRWQRCMISALRDLELTHVQFVLLASVWWLDGHRERPPTQRDVARHAGTDPMMTSQVLRALESRGHIERTCDPADGRVRRAAPTEAGRRLAQRAITVVEATDREFFADVDCDVLVPALRALVEGLVE